MLIFETRFAGVETKLIEQRKEIEAKLKPRLPSTMKMIFVTRYLK